jgi:aspartyl aminopeptidase
MHSPYETAGAEDTAYLVDTAKVLFSSSVEETGNGTYKLIFS